MAWLAILAATALPVVAHLAFVNRARVKKISAMVVHVRLAATVPRAVVRLMSVCQRRAKKI